MGSLWSVMQITCFFFAALSVTKSITLLSRDEHKNLCSNIFYRDSLEELGYYVDPTLNSFFQQQTNKQKMIPFYYYFFRIAQLQNELEGKKLELEK